MTSDARSLESPTAEISLIHRPLRAATRWSGAASPDPRQRLELVEWWWRRQRPFEGGGSCPPRIVPRPLLAHEGERQAVEEYQRADRRNVRADRGDEVPPGECIGIVGDAPRHPGEPKEVLREEHQVDTDEGHPEV